MTRAGLFVVIVTLGLVECAWAQTPRPAPPTNSAPAPRVNPAPASPASPAPAPAANPAAAKPAAEPYTYQPDGRRDPFVSLLGTGDTRPGGKRVDGVASMMVADIAVRGVLDSRGTLIAMVQGPDKKTYIVHPGDKLLDGTIRAITPQGLVIVQEVSDPLSLVKQREVRKLLRSAEEAKE